MGDLNRRRVALIIGVVLLLAVGAMVTLSPSTFTGIGQRPAHPRPVDPSTLPQRGLGSVSLSSLPGISNYSAILAQLNKSGSVHVPVTLQYVAQRFEVSLASLIKTLPQIRQQLSNATDLLAEQRLIEANLTLASAVTSYIQANATLTGLNTIVQQYASSLGVVPSKFTQKLDPVQATVSSYGSDIAALQSRIKADSPLLDATAKSVAYPGLSFEVAGRLASVGGEEMVGHKVVVAAFGESVSTVTSGDGSFAATLTTPSALPPENTTITVTAPSDETSLAAKLYLPVSVEKLQASLHVSGLGLALTGLPLAISGTTSANGTSLADALVRVSTPSGDVETTSNSQGEFSLEYYPPLFLGSGSAQLQVTVQAQQPWVGTALARPSAYFVNPLTALVPVGLISVIVVMGRERKKRAPTRELELAAPASGEVREVPHPVSRPEPMAAIYSEAVQLVSQATGIARAGNLTIREYLSLTREKLKWHEEFARISSLTEDVLYGAGSTREAEEEAKLCLEELRRMNLES